MAHLKNIILSERSQTQTSTIEWFHFYKILERQSHINWEQISRFQEPNEEEETDHKASQRKFPSEGDVLCHDYGGGSWLYQFSSVQSLCRVWLFAIPWTAARQASLSITNSWVDSWSLPKPMSIESVMLSNHLTLCRLFLLLPSIFPSIRVFSNESALRIRWPKY